MNLIDWIVVGVLGLSVLVGLYRGFISSVASMGSCLVSLIASYWLTPKIVDFVTHNTSLQETISSYTDATVQAGEWTNTIVSNLSDSQISSIISDVKMPAPLDSLLESNLKEEAFKSISGMTQNVGNYVSTTIVTAVLNIICFLAAFVILTILFHIIINLLNAIFKFPVLKQMNSVAGGLFGLLRGALLCFVAFAVLPLIQSVANMENLNELVASSTLAPVFNSRNLILSIMNGKL